MPWTTSVFWRKKPVGLQDLLELGGVGRGQRRRGRASGAKSSGVTMLTRTSVVCADRIVATRSSNALRVVELAQLLGRAGIDLGQPGARLPGRGPSGDRGRAMAPVRYGPCARLEIKRHLDERRPSPPSSTCCTSPSTPTATRRSTSTAGSTWPRAAGERFAGLVAWEPGHDHPVALRPGEPRARRLAGRSTSSSTPTTATTPAAIAPELLRRRARPRPRGGRRPRPPVGAPADRRPTTTIADAVGLQRGARPAPAARARCRSTEPVPDLAAAAVRARARTRRRGSR